MAQCERIRIDRVFYDQRFPIDPLVTEEINLAGLVTGGVQLDSVTVDVTVTSCDLDLTNDTISLEFFILKTLNFADGTILEFSFNIGVSDISLPKLIDTTIPDEFVDRLRCEAFDFTVTEEFTYNPGTQDFTDTLSIDITIKIVAFDQILVNLCPSDMTRTVTVQG